ncbi:unnamed protein product [Symbiodinium sp. CCMP2592]|nr:unnamed protein product [Symbiodinium sp. CCMP2592]
MPKRKWQSQSCQFCHSPGHNVRACPKLAQRLFKAVQRKHCADKVADAVSQGASSFAVCGIQVRYGSRKSAKKAENRRVRQVHRGTRGISSARKKQKRTAGKTWNEQRRTEKRKTKNEKLVQAALRYDVIGKAWSDMKQRGFVKPGVRGCRGTFLCPSCQDRRSCLCSMALNARQQRSAAEREKHGEWLQQGGRQMNTVWFRGTKCGNPISCIRFTHLPQMKYGMPLPQIMDFIKEFTDRAVPNLQDICKCVGVSRCPSSRKLYDFLLQKEAGIVEADGTALKLYKRKGHNNFIALWGLAERPQNENPARMVVYMMPVKQVAHNAVCPVESRADVLSCKGLEHVVSEETDSGKVTSLLVTDGAKLYERLAKEHKLKHRYVVHSKGQFAEKKRVSGRGTVNINTGLIDQRWSAIKHYVPKSLNGSSKEGSTPTFCPHL